VTRVLPLAVEYAHADAIDEAKSCFSHCFANTPESWHLSLL